MRALRTLTLLIAMAGASTARAEVKKSTPLSAIHAEAVLAFFNELVDHSARHAADCQALAEAADGVVNRHINTLQMMWVAKKNKQTVPAEVQAKLDERALEMVGALRRCWDDDRVKAAFKRMKPPPEKKQQ